MAETTTPVVPKTLLQAVNELLNSVRVSSVMSLLNTDLNEDASAAKSALDSVSIEVQGEGYMFNTEEGFVIDPAPSGEVFLPSNTLKVRTSRTVCGDRLVERGQRLYNPLTHSYNIGSSATVDIVLALPFEELPSAARAYITAIAARRFGVPRMPTSGTFRYTEELVERALQAMQVADSEHRDDDLTQTSPHFAKMSKR